MSAHPAGEAEVSGAVVAVVAQAISRRDHVDQPIAVVVYAVALLFLRYAHKHIDYLLVLARIHAFPVVTQLRDGRVASIDPGIDARLTVQVSVRASSIDIRRAPIG